MLGPVGLMILLVSCTQVNVYGSDVNWGKKVPCFMVQETVVCPGCNTRAGLSCPRDLKNSRNCLAPTTEMPYSSSKKPVTKEEELYNGEEFTNITESTISKLSTASSFIPVKPSKIPPPISTMNPVELAFFLYHMLGTKEPRQYRYRNNFGGYPNPGGDYYSRNRYQRDIIEQKDLERGKNEITMQTETEDLKDNMEDERETCNWNGDCPCPLICCKTGPGCPKKCVVGIRLPPPWGK